MKTNTLMNAVRFSVAAFALAAAGLYPQAGHAQIYEGTPEVYGSYNEYAYLKGYLSFEAEKSDSGTIWKEKWGEGCAPQEDRDGDGLSNLEEFNGWVVTVNDVTGWYSYKVPEAGKIWLGPGSDPVYYDTDCDGISDQYEKSYTRTAPVLMDTDGDGLPDAVETYARLDPCQDGYLYDFTTNTVTVTHKGVKTLKDDGTLETKDVTYEVTVVTAMTKQTDPIYKVEDDGSLTDTGKTVEKTTVWHPDYDIDGDGLSTKEELEPAISAMKGYKCPGARSAGDEPFPWTILNAAKWTSPVDCDTDGDYLLDSFEKAWSNACFDATVAEAEDADTHWSADPDGDGLVTFREQALHPLLSYVWSTVSFRDNALRAVPSKWPFASAAFKGTYGEELWGNGVIGHRYGGDRILNGVPGCLYKAQYGQAGDMQRVYTKDKDGNYALKGAEGLLLWMEPNGYWTNPKKADSDGDGLPDGWEVEHGLNPLGTPDDPSGTLGDPDQDGLVNYEEYFGQDGHRIDLVTGTGDETSPWITRGLNYPNQSPFDDYISLEGGKYWYIAREAFQAPYAFDVLAPASTYSEDKYPGLYLGNGMVKSDPMTGYSEAMTTFTQMGDDGSGNPVLVTAEGRTRIPAPGAPAPAMILNDMKLLAEAYGENFLLANNAALTADGEGAFQCFATAQGGLYYAEAEGAEDGRYTPGVDAVWYAAAATDGVYMDLTMNGDLVLADPNGILTSGVQGYPLYDNLPLMMPMPGRDTDNDGLPDSMEIQMDAGRGVAFSSPVCALSPLQKRAARIVSGDGITATLSTDHYVFSREYTVETWVYLDGAAPAEGAFVRGGVGRQLAFDLGVKPLRVGGTRVDPVLVDTVPYFGFHTLGGKWYEVSATRPLPRGRWVHLAGSFNPDKNALTLYIDGLLEQSREVQEESFATYILYQLHGVGTSLVFGQGTDFADRLWMDEIRIWGVERSAEQINANFRTLLQGYQTVQLDNQALLGGLMAYYPFDDGGTVAADFRHRALSSLQGYAYPAQSTVKNALRHEYFYPDLTYGLPTAELGGSFVFDSSNTAPVDGAADAQQGEWDSDGDGLPDSFELQHGLNPFSWYTMAHQYTRYDTQWANAMDAAVLVSRKSLLEWRTSVDGGATWTDVTCAQILSTESGVVTYECCPNTVLAASYDITTNQTMTTNSEGITITNYTVNVTTNWALLSGSVRDTIPIGETWWTTQSGSLVAKLTDLGKMLSDGDGDLDGDGLTNLQEYWARTNPNKFDTNENGISDGDEDFDGDGVPNLIEFQKKARPDLADTDDDGYDDLEEYSNGTSPSDPAEPQKSLAAYFDGRPGSRLDIRDATKYALQSWTIEARILPAGVDFLGDGQSAGIVRRCVEEVTNGMQVANYELRVVRDGDALYPMARYVYKNLQGIGVAAELRGEEPLATVAEGVAFDAEKETHLAVAYDAEAKRLTLYVNGQKAAERRELTASNARSGEGPAAMLRIGEGFRGFVDNVCVWDGFRGADAVLLSSKGSIDAAAAGLKALFTFDDGGWPDLLTSNTFATARCQDVLFSVVYDARPAQPADGDTWLEGTDVWGCDAGAAYKMGTVSDYGTVFCEGATFGVSPTEGQYGWSHLEQILYRYQEGAWVRWGKTPNWLLDVRSAPLGKIQSLDEILTKYDPTPGDQFVDTKEGVVYIFRETIPADRENLTGVPGDVGYVAELEADLLLPGQRFLLRSQDSVVEWTGTELVTVAHAYDRDGLYVNVMSEGMAYRSDAKRKYFRKWGFIPSLEDSTETQGWMKSWQTAAQSSGNVQLYLRGSINSAYTPTDGVDSDGDGLPDAWENKYGLDSANPGLPYGEGTVDVDGDGQMDYVYNPNDFMQGPWGDPDGDGLNNRAEWLAGTDPLAFDTDRDGVGDYDSARSAGGATFGALYMDGDDIPDGWEMLFPAACSPFRFDANLDPDGDGWDNYSEYMGVEKTTASLEYTVTTNDDVVSSNFVSGTGYSVPYCDPTDPSSHPKPDLTFHFKVDCERTGTLRIYAYSDRAMNCPDAQTTMKLPVPLRSGQSLSITDWTEGGYVKQGANYFMAYIDENNNSEWDEGELMGFSERMPENISWGSADIHIALTDGVKGYPRVSWAAQAGASTQILHQATFVFRRGGTELLRIERSGCANTRHFMHEYDFMQYPETARPLYNVYSWFVLAPGTSTAHIAEGVADIDYSKTMSVRPVIHDPVGTMRLAKTRMRLTLDRETTEVEILVKNALGATVLSETVKAPYIDWDNYAEMDFPQLLGWGGLQNGLYTLTVTAKNPRTSATSTPVNFTVALDPITEGGAAIISGTVHYYGHLKPAQQRIVVEAYATQGFDQQAMAKTLANADGTYELRGISTGPAFVRAFQDLNGNGELDPGEAWTLLKGAPEALKAITWVPTKIRGLARGGSNTVDATTMYATDYSAKDVHVQALKNYRDNDMVLHDADTDGDGLPDVWELWYAGNLTTMNQYSDLDGDGLLDVEELMAGTYPNVGDTDGDGLSDAEEVHIHGTDPLKADTDGDGLSDLFEINYGTDPKQADTDGDGIGDGDELSGWGGYMTDPLKADTDDDGIDDLTEIELGYNPTDPADGLADEDNDGLTTAEELKIGTDPTNPDTDGDGWLDGEDPAPLDPNDPGVPPGSKVAFQSISAKTNSARSNAIPMALTVRSDAVDVQLQSTTNLTGAQVWKTVVKTNLTGPALRREVLVPAGKNPARVKMYRILYTEP